jgi:hypothetical protein
LGQGVLRSPPLSSSDSTPPLRIHALMSR